MLSVCKNTLPAKANLVKRKVVEDPLCPIGGADVETTGHNFWKCTVARDTWSMCGRRLQKSSARRMESLFILWKSCKINWMMKNLFYWR
jgi:hypothetical protein